MNVCNKCSFCLFSFFILYYVTKQFVQAAENVSPDNVNAISLLPSNLKKEEIINVTPWTIFPNTKILIVRDNPGCDCVNTSSSNNCECCAIVDIWWTDIFHGKFCANATYLSKEIGFSVTVTYNNKRLINETVTALDSPPFCVDASEELKLDLCLDLHKINFTDGIFRCSELEIKDSDVIRVIPSKIQLGCFDLKHPSS